MMVRQLGVVFALLLISLGPTQLAAQEDAAESIGWYVRLGSLEALTVDDVISLERGVRIEAPALSSELRIEHEWIESEIGDWSAGAPFTVDDTGMVVFEGNRVELQAWTLSPVAALTLGSYSSVRLAERPALLSLAFDVDQIQIVIDGGDDSHQTVSVSATWLGHFGIGEPRFLDGDGRTLSSVARWASGAVIYEVEVGPEGALIVEGIAWNLDSETGTLWRELSPAEYEISPWEDFPMPIYATQTAGDVNAVPGAHAVEIDVAMNGAVRTLTFQFARTLNLTSATQWASTIPDAGRATELREHSTRIYRGTNQTGDDSWLMAVSQAGGLAASGTNAGQVMKILKNSPDWDMETFHEDVFFSFCLPDVLVFGCADDSGSGGGGGSDPDPAVEKTVYYAGELDWCQHQGQGNWVDAIGVTYERGVEAFAPTEVKLLHGATTCWFTVDGSEHDHDTEYWHEHIDGGSSHLYPYNGFGGHDCERYLGRVDDDFDHAYPDGLPYEIDNYQVVHQELCATDGGDHVAGVGDAPGEDSLATPLGRPWATSHELGHNLDAIHGAAVCMAAEGTVSLMAEPNDPACSDGTEVRINAFSDANIGRINAYV